MKTDIFGEDIAESQPSPEAEETVFETEKPAEGQEGDLQEQEAPEKGQPSPSLYAGKFKNEDELEQGYINLMNYLGKDLGEFTSAEDLEKAYLDAEKERGKPKEQRLKEPQPNQEVEQLKQAYQQQQQQMQQLVGYLQAMQQAQQTGQSTPQKKEEEKVDPAALLDEWYENPQATLNKMVAPMLQEQLQKLVPQYAQELDKRMNERLSPYDQRLQFERHVQQWSNAVNELERELPDFGELRKEIALEMEKDQNLVAIGQSHPEGKKIAIRAAYDRVKAINAQRDGLDLLNQQQTKQSVLQKQAGKMGSSSKVLKKPEPTEEQKLLSEIFGASNQKGIFG